MKRAILSNCFTKQNTEEKNKAKIISSPPLIRVIGKHLEIKQQDFYSIYAYSKKVFNGLKV